MKIATILMAMVLAGLIFVSQVSAETGVSFQVQPDDTVNSIAQKYTGSPNNWQGLIARKVAGGHIKLTTEDKLTVGETLYIVQKTEPSGLVSRAPAATIQSQTPPMDIKNLPTNYVQYEVKKDDYVMNLIQQETGDWKNCFKWYKKEGNSLIEVNPNGRFVAGDVLYRPAQEPSQQISQSPPPSVSSPDNSEKTLVGAGYTSNNQSQTETPSPAKEKTITERVAKNWDGRITYSQYDDLDGGRGDDAKRDGYNLDAKLTILPWKVKDWKVGPEIRYNQGESNLEKSDGYKGSYPYRRFEIGARTEKNENNTILGFEGGLSRQITEQDNSPKNQTTDSLHLRADYENEKRRAAGALSFPAYSLYAQARLPFNTEVEGGALTYDEQTVGFGGTLDLYDYTTESGMFITPKANLGFGNSWGKDSTYISFGPEVAFGENTGKKGERNEYGSLRFLNPMLYLQNKGASVLETFAITLRPDDIYRGIQASQVKKYENSETSPSK